MKALNNYPALLPEKMRPRDREKFFSYLKEDDGCLIWTGTMLRNRPTFRWSIHRTSPARMLLLMDGKIDTMDTVVLDCENNRCVRHVRVYTPKEYARRLGQIRSNSTETIFIPEEK